MSLFRKVVASVALTALVISTGATGVSAYSTENVTAANGLAAAKVINDHANDPAKYNLDQNIVRQETAKVAVNLNDDISVKTTCENKFSDVSATTPNDWACGYVEALLDAGKVSANAKFNPEKNVTKSEAVKMMLDAAGCSDFYSDAAKWQEQTVAFASENGIAASFTDYNTPASRGFVFGVAYNAMNKCPIEDEVVCDETLAALGLCELPNNNGNNQNNNGNNQNNNGNNQNNNGNNQNAEASVSLSSETPVDGNIPSTAANVEFLKFNVTAGDEDLKLESAIFKRVNLGSRDDFKKVWLTVDGVVVSNDKTIASNDTVNIPFSYTVEAGKTIVFTLNASMKGNVNKVNSFELTSLKGNSKEVAGTPITGAALTTVNYDVAQLTFTAKGTASNIDVGEEGVTVGEFKLAETQTNSKKNVIFKTIRFKNTGSADLENLSDIILYVDGQKVSTETSIDGKYVTFKLNNLVIEDAKSKRFTIKSNVVDGKDGENITFVLKDIFDIYAIEEGTNIGASIAGNGNISLSAYTLNAGKVKVSEDASNPANTYIIKDTSDNLVLVSKVDLGQAVTVDSLKLYLNGTSIGDTDGNGTANTITDLNKAVENVRVYVNDKLVDSVDKINNQTNPTTTTVTNTDYYLFDSSFELHDNDLIKVYVDVTKDTVANASFKVKVNNTGVSDGNSSSLTDVEYVSNGDSVHTADFGGTASSKGLVVRAATQGISVVRNDGYTNGEVVLAGQKDAKLLGFIVNAGTESDVKIEKLEFDFGYGAAAFPANEYTNYTNCKLTSNGQQVGNSEDLTSANNVVIEDLGVNITKNSQQEFALSCDIDLSASEITPRITLDLTNSSTVSYDQNDNEINLSSSDVVSPNLSVKTNATLAVNIDGDTPDEAIVISKSNDIEVAKYKFEANDGDVKVKELKFKDNTTKANTTRIKNYKLYVNNSPIASRTPVNGAVYFDLGTNGFIVPKDDKVVLTVKTSLNDITDEAQTDEAIHLQLEDIVAETVATSNDLTKVNGNVAIDSDGNGTQLHASNISANTMYIRKTQPIVAVQDLGTTKLSNGEQTLFKFTVNADSNADVDVAKINFNVNAQGVTLSGYKLYVNGTDKTSDGAFVGSAFTFNNNKNTVVPAGGSKTFELKATVAGVNTDGDSVSVKIVEDTNHANAATKAAATGNLVWSDHSASPHSDSTVDYFNGYKVVGLDTNTTTLEK